MDKQNQRKLTLSIIDELEKVTRLKDISEEEYRLILGSNHRLELYRNYHRSRTIFTKNINYLSKTLEGIWNEIIQPKKIPSRRILDNILKTVATDLFNFTSAFFSYVEFMEAWIKRNLPDQINKFNQVKGNYFDGYFGYRFFYKLRNFSVHLGIPIEYIRHIQLDDGDEHIFMFLSVGKLLDSFDWGKHVKPDLETKFPDGIIPIASEFFNFKKILPNLIKEFDQLTASFAVKDVNFLVSIAGHHNYEKDVLVVIETLSNPDDKGNLKYETPLESLVIPLLT